MSKFLRLLVCAAISALPVSGSAVAQGKDTVLGSAGSPVVTHVGRVAPNVLGVTLEAQRRVPGQAMPYIAQPGDEIVESEHERWLRRSGDGVGSIVGRDASILYTFDRIEGSPLDLIWAKRPDNYRLVRADGRILTPSAVARKSKPIDEVRSGEWHHSYPSRHVIYLTFDESLRTGVDYKLELLEHKPFISSVSFTIDDTRLRSEAVRVSHVGFRPNDLVKVGYLSLWKGDAGGMEYASDMGFRVVAASGDTVFEGQVELSLGKGETESGRNRNYSLTDVYRLDFSSLVEPGEYRIVVDGVGCSYPFKIADSVWADAFRVAMMGLLHHRSGIELGPPLTDYARPRTMVPGEDGFRVLLSDVSIVNPDGSELGQEEAFGQLVDNATDVVALNAWGGYMDAGDWDRRVQHLFATRLLIELYEFNPVFFDGFALNLPAGEAANNLPDILDEAVFNLDLYRRLQTEDGGVHGWIESAGHPRYGEASWQESLQVYVTTPEPYATYCFVSTSARFARVVDRINPDLSVIYAEAAATGFDWAETELIEGDWDTEYFKLRDARNLAAVELYRLTGNDRYHAKFLETTAFDQPRTTLQSWEHFHQRENAYAYAAIEELEVDADVQRNAVAALKAEADDRVALSLETGFGWTNDRTGWVGWGQQSSLNNSLALVRAHVHTGDPRYLAAIQRAIQFMAGANPMNISLTTGVGHDWPRNVLHIDSHFTNQPVPSGITIYGPDDPTPWAPDQELYWSNKKMEDAGAIFPSLRTWPALESHWDIFMHPASSEYTIMQNIGPTAYLWGYLASHDGSEP